MANALEVINSDPNVRAIFINIFGGITRGEEVANGIVQALERVAIGAPMVIRLDGTNAEEGRTHPEEVESDRVISSPTMLEAARKAVELAPGSAGGAGNGDLRGREAPGSLVQGLTGGQGRFHGLRNRAYGTQVVAGVTPGKGGQDVEGIPVFDTVAEAVAATGANASFVSVPPAGRGAAILEAAEAGVPFVVCITEGIPAHDEARVYNTLVDTLPRDPPARAQLPGDHQPRASATSGSPRARSPCPAARSASCQPLRDPHLPGPLRAQAARGRGHHLRRHRRRPGAGDELRRLPGRLPGRPRHQGHRHVRRDRWVGGGEGGRLHRRGGDRSRWSPTSPG